MAQKYAELAPTRPRVQRDVLYTQTPEGVLFHNAKGGFHLNGKSAYRLAELIVPHLNGVATVADICESMQDTQREMVASLVGALYSGSFARDLEAERDDDRSSLDDAVAETFEAQLNYIDHYAGTPIKRLRHLRQATIAVLGGGEVAEHTALGLIRNGAATIAIDAELPDTSGARNTELERLTSVSAAPAIATVDSGAGWPAGADFVIVASAHSASLCYDLLDSRPRGATMLPAWPFGDLNVVGPLLTDGNDDAWAYTIKRLGANVDAGGEAQVWRELLFGDEPRQELSGPLAAMLGNLLAFEAFKHFTGCLPPETRNAVVLQDTQSLDTTSEAVLGSGNHPGTPAPVTLSDAISGDQAWEPSAEGTDPVSDELNTLTRLVQPHVGVFSAFSDQEWLQTPVKVATVDVAPDSSSRTSVTAFDLYTVAGGRKKALYEAARHYGHRWAKDGKIVLGQERPEADGVSVAATDAGLDLNEAVKRALARALSARYIDQVLRGSASAEELDISGWISDDTTSRRERELTFLWRASHTVGVSPLLLSIRSELGNCGRTVIAFDRAGNHTWAAAFARDEADAAITALLNLVGNAQVRKQSSSARASLPPGFDDLDPRLLARSDTARPLQAEVSSWSDIGSRLAARGVNIIAHDITPDDINRGGLSLARVTLWEAPSS